MNDAYLAYVQENDMNSDDYHLSIRANYIFLLDRSGSMSGRRIKDAKETLILFLKSLPVNSTFNIISFGSDYEFMFKTSQSNDEIQIE